MHKSLFLLFLALAVAQELRADSDGMVIVPALGKVPKECTHLVPDGTHVIKKGEHTWVVPPTGKPWKLPRCNAAEIRQQRQVERFPSSYRGWLGYTTWKLQENLGDTFDAFTGYFSVPNFPAREPEVLFIFTGLQNVDWIPIVDPEPSSFDILQPVLQYPADVVSDASRGSWGVRSWYVSLNQNTVYTNEISAEPGSKIFGNMTRISGNKWLCDSVNARGEHAPLNVNHEKLAKQPWAYTTIELYADNADCDVLPTNGCQFSDMVLAANGKVITSQAQWVKHTTPNPVCAVKPFVNDSATVYYSFQK